MKFKVGDRVFHFTVKIYGTVYRVSGNNCGVEWDDGLKTGHERQYLIKIIEANDILKELVCTE